MEDNRTYPVDRPAIDISLLLVRMIVGVIFAMHGAQKLFGVWGGPGIQALVQPPPDGMGPIGYLVSIGEFFGGLGLIVGFLSRFSAAANIVIMIGAIAMVHGHSFFLKAGGFEYNLALIGLLLPILLCGPGRISIGRFLFPKSARTDRPNAFIE